jgi:hypothetical protein
MSELVLVTDSQPLRQRLTARLRKLSIEFAGRYTSPVRPLVVDRPDNRKLDGRTKYWSPWQEGIAAAALDGAYRVTGSLDAKYMRDVVVENVTRHGVWEGSDGWEAGAAVAWGEGGQILRPPFRESYRPYLLWCSPAVRLAMRDDKEPWHGEYLRVIDSSTWKSREWLFTK